MDKARVLPKEEKEMWIITVSDTNKDGTEIWTLHGTEQNVRAKMLRLISRDVDEIGAGLCTLRTQKETDFRVLPDGRLYGVACFWDNHIDYTAQALREVPCCWGNLCKGGKSDGQCG